MALTLHQSLVTQAVKICSTKFKGRNIGNQQSVLGWALAVSIVVDRKKQHICISPLTQYQSERQLSHESVCCVWGQTQMCYFAGRPTIRFIAVDEYLPLTSFEQDEVTVSYKIESPLDHMESNYWSMGIINHQELFVRMVTVPPELWIGHLKLHDKLTDDTLNFKFENQSKNLVITLRKPKAKIWKSIGPTQKEHNKFMDSRAAPVDFYGGTIVVKEKMPSSAIFIGVKFGQEVHFGCPVAWHMKFRINGIEKKYTPVKLITTKQSNDYESYEDTSGQVIFFIIRVYKNGRLTPLLNNIELDKPKGLDIGGICGNFDTAWLQDTDRLILMAGGTGITPFVTIIKHIKEKKRDARVKQVILFLSGTSPADLIWDDIWKTLRSKLDWFHYIPYVTTPTSNWSGNRERISPGSIQTNLDGVPFPEDVSKETVQMKGCGCGPAGFTDTCQTIFDALGFDSKDVFMFEG